MNKKKFISTSDSIILKLKILAEEKEIVRQKLAITALKLATTAKKLAVTAREKESVRRKLALTAEKLKKSYQTLEKKVLDRTKSLEMSRAKEEAILLSIGDGLLVTDEKGNIIIFNKPAEKLFGKKLDEVFGKSLSSVICFENAKGAPVPIIKFALNVTPVTDMPSDFSSDYYYTRKDKTKFPVAVMVNPVVLGGKIIGSIGVFRDVTSEREIDKAKTEFVSLASHQLRTPLSTVNWYAEMLLAGDVGDLNEKQKKYLDEVYRSNQRMVELVNALLDVSSLELGTFAIEPEPTDICKLAQNVIDEQIQQINAKKIAFAFICKKDTIPVLADPKLIRMVMQNILSNSVKYTPNAGKIDFSISFAGKKILLKIVDNGYGIPKNQHDKIFTKLFRADNVRDKDTDGTGLGLYIVKSIVENLSGKVWFKSAINGRNVGTTFYVELPLVSLK